MDIMTDVLTISIDDADAAETAARAIAAGGVIAFPTDTVYGLGVDLWQPSAIAGLYRVKGRPDDKALPVLMADPDDWRDVALAFPATAQRLAAAFWPGGLTLVLRRRPEVPDAVAPLAPTIALRVPDHTALQRVLARTGPLASSSANLSGQPTATSATAVRAMLGHGLALVLDGGTQTVQQPSTIVDVTGAVPVILRHGAISDADIARVLA